MNLLITGVRILHRATGSDIVWLETPNPEGMYPFTGLLTLEFHCARGTAETYVEQNFLGVPVEVITQQDHRGKFSKS